MLIHIFHICAMQSAPSLGRLPLQGHVFLERRPWGKPGWWVHHDITHEGVLIPSFDDTLPAEFLEDEVGTLCVSQHDDLGQSIVVAQLLDLHPLQSSEELVVYIARGCLQASGMLEGMLEGILGSHWR